MTKAIDMRAAWNRSSASYQARHRITTDSAHYGPWCPDENRLRLLGDVTGRRILELGCGGGQCSIAFAHQGASATGIDLSDEQIAFARRLAAREGVVVDFHQGNAADLSRFPSGAFDAVFSAYALSYVAEIEQCLAGAFRVLKAGGQMVFSLDHPFRDCFWDEEADDETYTPDFSYFRRGPMTWRFGVEGEWMRSFHRTVGDWVDLLAAAGFRLERILEPEPELSREVENTWADSYDLEFARQVPQTVIFVARKEARGILNDE